MSERKIVLQSYLPERNLWHIDHYAKTLDCDGCQFKATVVDTEEKALYDVCLWGAEWKLIRGGTPTRKCELLQKERPGNHVFKNGIPKIRHSQMYLPLIFDFSDISGDS